jgi:hypothetical protein
MNTVVNQDSQRATAYLKIAINYGSKRLGLKCDDITMNLEDLSSAFDGEIRMATRPE